MEEKNWEKNGKIGGKNLGIERLNPEGILGVKMGEKEGKMGKKRGGKVGMERLNPGNFGD